MDKKLDDMVSRWVRPEVRELKAYHVPDASGMVKLDAMENPYEWPDYLRGDWLEQMNGIALNRYPDPSGADLKIQLRKAFDIPANMDVLLGNGSDELIQLIDLAVKGDGRKVMSPEPSFSMYRMISVFVGLDYIAVPLKTDDFSLDMPAMLEAIKTHQPAVIYLSYPNNPTGNLFAEDEMIQIIKASEGLVVVDEAYTPFAGTSMMSRLGEYKNLLVMRTLSKMGLAGLRLGMLAGPAALLGELDKLRLPYKINVLTQFTADFALGYHDVFDEQTKQICRDRAWMVEHMQCIPEIEVFPSAANFILFRAPKGRGDEIFDLVKQRGVLIKNLNGSSEMLQDCLRVTVGKPSENCAFLTALSASL